MIAEENTSLHFANWPSRFAAYVIDYILYMIGVAVSMVGLFIILIALFEGDVVHDAESFSDLAGGTDATLLTVGPLIFIVSIELLVGYIVW